MVRASLSRDRLKATLFLVGDQWPSKSRVQVVFDGNGLRDVLGRELDMDKDGKPGGVARFSFETLGVEGILCLCGGAGARLGKRCSWQRHSIEWVIIQVVGTAGTDGEICTVTDAQGNFTLKGVPWASL